MPDSIDCAITLTAADHTGDYIGGAFFISCVIVIGICFLVYTLCRYRLERLDQAE